MIATGAVFGSWKVAALDPTGKPATCVCSCGTARQFAVAALMAGDSRGCGCSATPRPSSPRSLSRRFEAEVVAEFAAGRARHWGHI
jgi:hypothetical protein